MNSARIAAILVGCMMNAIAIVMLASCNGILGLDERPAASDGASSSSSSSSSSGAGGGGDGTTEGDGTATSSGGDADAGDGACFNGPIDINIKGPSAGGGDAGVIAGRIMFATPVADPQTTPFTLMIGTKPTWGGNPFVNGGAVTKPGPTTEYTFARTLAPGTYYLSITINTNKDGLLNEQDMGGFYNGTTNSPAPPSKATPIVVTQGKTTCASFGIGAIPCLLPWGDACVTDLDCRPTLCRCVNDVPTTKLTRTDGSCSPTKQCRKADGNCGGISCDTGPGPTEVQGDCIGK